MNTWVQFFKQYYSGERKRDPSKCRDSGTLKRVSKIYKCMKKMNNRTKKNTDKFRGSNPMHKKRK